MSSSCFSQCCRQQQCGIPLIGCPPNRGNTGATGATGSTAGVATQIEYSQPGTALVLTTSTGIVGTVGGSTNVAFYTASFGDEYIPPELIAASIPQVTPAGFFISSTPADFLNAYPVTYDGDITEILATVSVTSVAVTPILAASYQVSIDVWLYRPPVAPPGSQILPLTTNRTYTYLLGTQTLSPVLNTIAVGVPPVPTGVIAVITDFGGDLAAPVPVLDGDRLLFTARLISTGGLGGVANVKLCEAAVEIVPTLA